MPVDILICAFTVATLTGAYKMLHHIVTHRAGSAGYYAPRQRGTVTVEHDQRRYVYRKPSWQGIKVFKRELAEAFGVRDWRGNVRVCGSYPSYTIETRD